MRQFTRPYCFSCDMVKRVKVFQIGVASTMKNRDKGTFETNRFSMLLGEGASALFLLFLASLLLAPEALGHTLSHVLRLMVP